MTLADVRTCTVCGEQQPMEQFALKGQGRRHASCKRCMVASQLQRVALRRASGLCLRCGVPARSGLLHCAACAAAQVRRVTVRAQGRRKPLKAMAVAYLGGRCQDCGLVAEYPQVYDFHHRDSSQKEHAITTLIIHGQAWARIQRELDKCDLLCANCHRIRHAREDQEQ